MDQQGEYARALETLGKPVTFTFGVAEAKVSTPRDVRLRIGRNDCTFRADLVTTSTIVDDDGTHVTAKLSPVGTITRTARPNRSKGWRRHIRRTKQERRLGGVE